MKLPTELRREIFAESLPAKDVLIHPKCDDDKGSESVFEINRRWIVRNRASDLMTINKKISGEVAEAIYQERTFVVHVHEGLKNGGIEFLHTKRQPLQYQDDIADSRFWKFSETEKDFGFRRLKKIHVRIFPSEENNSKHSAINTYFMNLALVRLLERGGDEKNDISSLSIEFMQSKTPNDQEGRLAMQRAEQYWWDPDKKLPRESSIHGLPNIELVLRPFANLTACHKVNIELPHNLALDPRIAKFVQDLKASMTSRSRFSTMFADDDLELKIESARWAMEDYVNFTLHGTRHHKVDNLRDDEVQEPGPDTMDLDSDDEEGAIPAVKKTERVQIKRSLSPASQSTSPGSDSKKSRTAEKIVEWQAFSAGSCDQSSEPSPSHYSLEDDEALARALYESQRMEDTPSSNDAEDRQLQAAIAASMDHEEARRMADEEVRTTEDGKAREMAADRRNKWAAQARQQTGPLKVSNRFSVLSTADNSEDSAFVGQGRALSNSSNGASPSAHRHSHLDRFLADGDAPWSGSSNPTNSYKKKTNINGSVALPTMPPARMSGTTLGSQPKPMFYPSASGETKPKMSTGSPPTKKTSQLDISGSETHASRQENTDAGSKSRTTQLSPLQLLNARRARLQQLQIDSDDLDTRKS